MINRVGLSIFRGEKALVLAYPDQCFQNHMNTDTSAYNLREELTKKTKFINYFYKKSKFSGDKLFTSVERNCMQ